jgi:hypothetical protein
MLLLNRHVDPPHIGRRLEEVVAVAKITIPSSRLIRGSIEIAADPADHLLGGGQIAGRQQHEQPIRRRLEHIELAVGGDVVDPGIGAGIGDQHQALLQPVANAVGHRFS